MKTPFRNSLLTKGILLMSLFGPLAAHADDTASVFTVVEGAAPWSDRVGQWTLTQVPDDLKNSGPLPQGNCSSRSLEIPGKPASIIIGVQTNDVAKFMEKCPEAKETGTQIAVKDPTGTTLPYVIFTLANPPSKIDGAGVFGAGLLLLKVL